MRIWKYGTDTRKRRPAYSRRSPRDTIGPDNSARARQGTGPPRRTDAADRPGRAQADVSPPSRPIREVRTAPPGGGGPARPDCPYGKRSCLSDHSLRRHKVPYGNEKSPLEKFETLRSPNSGNCEVLCSRSHGASDGSDLRREPQHGEPDISWPARLGALSSAPGV